jgi:hypothetical protein
MTYDKFAGLCGKLFTEHRCDPTELHLSTESRRELTTTLLARGDAWTMAFSADLISDPQPGGVLLQAIVNPITKSVIAIEESDNGLPDFFITRVYV